MVRLMVYDIECLLNIFTFRGMIVGEEHQTYKIEISDDVNEIEKLHRLFSWMQGNNIEMVGFNNWRYDYPVLHEILYTDQSVVTAQYIRHVSDSVFHNKEMGGFAPVIWKPLIPQWDLMLIHHFNNKSRMTSLKAIEYWQKRQVIDEFEYGFDEYIPPKHFPRVHGYNLSDVEATVDFCKYSMDMIQIRHDLMKTNPVNMRWHNNGKIGQNIIIDMLGISSKDKGTPRHSVYLGDVMSPMIDIHHVPAFKEMFKFLSSQTVYKTKGALSPENLDLEGSELLCHMNRVFTPTEIKKIEAIRIYEEGTGEDYPKGTLAFIKRYVKGTDTVPTGKIKKLNVVHQGLEYVFGTGGLHASRSNEVFRATDEMTILDWDFKAWYPSLGRVLDIAPAQFSKAKWRTVMEEIARRRDTFKKGTAGYQQYKDAGNIPYGQSGFPESCFYDPKYMLTICLNGQLLLISLIEWLLQETTAHMIQANTDGITFILPRSEVAKAEAVRDNFESHIGVILEQDEYKSMHIRDVNNYIAVYTNGKIKAKGAYEVDKLPHKDTSMLVVQKAVMAHLLEGVEIEDFIYSHKDMHDFTKRLKLNKKFEARTPLGKVDGKLIRYYCSTVGVELTKHNIVDNTSPTSVCSMSPVTLIRDMSDTMSDINYQYYVNEAYKLLKFEEVCDWSN